VVCCLWRSSARVLSLFLHVAVFVSETEFHRQECLSLCIFFVLCVVGRAWLQRALLADDRTEVWVVCGRSDCQGSVSCSQCPGGCGRRPVCRALSRPCTLCWLHLQLLSCSPPQIEASRPPALKVAQGLSIASSERRRSDLSFAFPYILRLIWNHSGSADSGHDRNLCHVIFDRVPGQLLCYIDEYHILRLVGRLLFDGRCVQLASLSYTVGLICQSTCYTS